jgi:autotransporter-associated beta strand protein
MVAHSVTQSLGANVTNNVITLTNGATLVHSATSLTLNQTLNVKGANTYVNGTAENWNGMIIGDGTLLLNLTNNQLTTGGNNAWNSNVWAGFAGTVILTGGGNLRFDANNASTFTMGSRHATFDLGTTNNTMNERGATGIAVHTTFLGALKGGRLTAISANGTSGTTNTFQIGDANLNTTFSGKINNASGVFTAVTKSGSGTLALDNTNGYSGSTLIQQGSLALTPIGNIRNSISITVVSNAAFDVSAGQFDGVSATNDWAVAASQTLAGGGVITGNVTTATGTIAPGFGTNFGVLSFSNNLTLNAGAANVFKAGGGANDQIKVAGNLTLNGVTVIVTPPSGASVITDGSYPLFAWSGALTGDANSITLVYSAQPGTITLATNLVTKQIVLQVSGAAVKSLTWKGDGSANNWDHSSLNWLNGAVSSAFAELDNVTFNDSGSINPPVDLVEVVNPSSLVFNTTNKNYVLTSSGGQISGLTGLTKNGPGTVILDENNNYSGATTINAGTLQVGNNDTSGTLGTGSLVNNGTLVYDRVDTVTLASALSGSGALVQNGTNGNLVLTADSVNGGGVLVNAGTLQMGDGTSIHGSTTSGITNNATLHYYYNGDVTIANTLSGSGTVLYDLATGNHTYTIPVNFTNINFTGTNILNVGIRLHASDGNGGYILGNGGVVDVESSGSQIWLDRSATSYNQTFILSGTGWTGDATPVGAMRIFGCTVSGPVILTGDTRIGGSINGGTISGQISGNYQLEVLGNTNSFILSLGPTNGANNWGPTLVTSGAIRALNSGGISTNALTVDLNGEVDVFGNNVAVNSLNDGGSGAGVIYNMSTATNGTLTVGMDDSSTSFDGVFGDGASKTLSLTKVGAGTLTLSAVSTNSGTVAVNGGTLALAGSGSFGNAAVIAAGNGATFDVSGRGDGTLTLSSGQTLKGNGTVNGILVASAGSTVSPGSSVGTLTVSGDVMLGGTLLMELNRTNTPFNCDQLVSSGGTITYGGALSVANVGPALHVNDTFQLFPAAVTGFSAISLPATDANGMAYTWTNRIGQDGSIQVLTATPAIAGYLFRSVTNGNWSDASTWQQSSNGVNWAAAIGSPDYTSSNILIQTGNIVTNTVDVTVDQVTIQSNATVVVTSGSLTINDGADVVDFLVAGTLEVGAGIGTLNVGLAGLTFTNGGAFNWNRSDVPAIPAATWRDGSVCRVSATAGSSAFVTGISGQSLYDFIWDTTAAGQSARSRFNIQGTNTTIRRDFTITLPDTSGASVTINNETNGVLTVGRNVALTGGTSANSTKILLNNGSGNTYLFKVGGNFSAAGYIDGFGGSSTLFEFNGTGTQSLRLPPSTNLITSSVMNWLVDAGSSVAFASSIQGFNTLTNNGTLTFGANAITGGGTLVFNSSGTVNGNGTNQLVSGISSILNGGTLNLGVLPAFAGGESFQLFGATTYGGSFGTLLPVTPDGTHTWVATQLNSAGILAVSGGVNTNAPRVQVSVAGKTLSLAWPTNAGWTLLTNSVGLAATNQWFPYPNSANLTNVDITMDPTKPNVFFRMVYPYP